MILPKIAASSPKTILPLPTVYADLFVEALQVRAAPGQPWPLTVCFVPYDFASDMIIPTSDRYDLLIADLKLKAAEYPATIGRIVADLIGVLTLLLREQELQGALAEGADVQTELDKVQSQLRGE